VRDKLAGHRFKLARPFLTSRFSIAGEPSGGIAGSDRCRINESSVSSGKLSITVRHAAQSARCWLISDATCSGTCPEANAANRSASGCGSWIEFMETSPFSVHVSTRR